MKKVLVLGSSGMAGHVVFSVLKGNPLLDVVGIDRKFQFSVYCSEFFDWIAEQEFDYVINLIGLLVKESNINKADAVYINAYLPHRLHEACFLSDAKLIHLSTDCVFRGTEGRYTENHQKDGEDWYSKTKGLGEVVSDIHALTIRTSIIGPELKANGTGLFHWWATSTESVITGYSKAMWTGLTTYQLAKALEELVRGEWIIPSTPVVHLVPKYWISKFDVLNIFNAVFERPNLTIEPNDKVFVDKSLIDTEDFGSHLKSLFSTAETAVTCYTSAIRDLRNWIIINRELYTHKLYQPVLSLLYD